MLVSMVSPALSPGSMLASEPVARTTFFALNLALRAVCRSALATVMHAVLSRAGEASVAVDDGDLVLLHQVVEALDVFSDDLVFARRDGFPVELTACRGLDAVVLGVLQVVVDLGVKEQRLGGDAAHSAGRCRRAFGLFQSARPSGRTVRRESRRCIRRVRRRGWLRRKLFLPRMTPFRVVEAVLGRASTIKMGMPQTLNSTCSVAGDSKGPRERKCYEPLTPAASPLAWRSR